MRTGLEDLHEKIALVAKKKKKDSTHLGRTLGSTAAMGALPFAGMIGQSPVAPAVRNVGQARSIGHAISQMQPGDIVLTGGKPSRRAMEDLLDAKGKISLSTGTPEGYHVGVVRRAGPRASQFRMVHSHPATGVGLAGPSELEGRVTVLRPQLKPEEMQQFLTNLDKDVAMGKSVTQALNSNKRLREAIADNELARAGLYHEGQGIRAGLKELFVPKVHSAKAVEASRQQARAARDAFQPKPYLDQLAHNIDKVETSTGAAAFLPHCVGSVCSTLPAGALPAGRHVVPGKLVSDVLPSDYLRNKELFKPVTKYNPFKRSRTEQALEHGPLASRLLTSVALMGLTYGANKLYDHFRSA